MSGSAHCSVAYWMIMSQPAARFAGIEGRWCLSMILGSDGRCISVWFQQFEGSGTDILPCLLRHYHCFKEIGLVDILLSHIISVIQSRRARFSCLAFLMGPVELFGVCFNGPSKCFQPCLQHRTCCLWHLCFHASCSMATAEDKLPSSISRRFKCKSLYCRSSFPCVL